MNWYDKVVWHEGMFLRSQHFQQQDRHFGHRIEARAAPLRPWPWGLTEVALNRDLLAAGKFALAAAAGVLEDGTPFAIPATCDPPTPIDIPDSVRNTIVYLAAPVRQPHSPEVAFAAPGSAAARGADMAVAPYGLASFEAPDTHSDSTLSAELLVARPRLRFLLESEDRAGFTCLPLARIVEVAADRRVLVDERFIPTVLRLSAHPPLLHLVGEVLGMVIQRADAHAARLAQPGIRDIGSAAQFLQLATLNRWQPLLAHWADAGAAHPETLYAALVQMAGELATFVPDMRRRCSTYPGYRHENLQRSFDPVAADLRRALAGSMLDNVVQIALRDGSHGLRIGPVGEHRPLLRSAKFVLSVAADMRTEQLRRSFPNLVTIGAIERIKDLVNVRLPGIGVEALQVAPPQIPFHAGSVYFELDRNSPDWQQMLNSGAFAIYVSGDFPNLRMELWAILG